MRNTLRIALVGAALSAVSFASAASAATSATANATAEVLSTLTLTADSALNFGQIAANTGGTVTVNADSTVASSGTLVSTGTRAPAGFTVTGTPNANVVLTLPASATLTRSRRSGVWGRFAMTPRPCGSMATSKASSSRPNSAANTACD